MQNVGQSENRNVDKVNVQLDVVKSSTPHSSASSPAKSETETYSGAPAKYMTDSSESEDDSVSEAEMDEEGAGADASKFLAHDDSERTVDPEMQARLEALLEAAGIGKLSGEGKHLADPEVLRRLTSSVSCALDEAAAALTRMRSDQPTTNNRQEKPTQCVSTGTTTTTTATASVGTDGVPSLAEACSDGDVGTVRKLLTEGRSVHETTEEGESLLSLACSAGYYELAQVLLAMHASVEDRGIKGDCTPLMEAASAGHVDIVKLLIKHDADVNAVSVSGNTSLMYACSGGHEACVQALLDSGANVEDHNENGHTPLMEAASAGHVGVAKILLEHGAGINTHSNEFKESALTLACYKGHLDMVRFLLAAGADREHKTDEMHTALMEASMDGHVEVARLLLDSGAQVNMPTDSFESPLTLAACGGHVELAMLLLERGANIEEVNDEGYTPLMEAAREGHEEMVALLLGQGACINAQTEETQETALTLACCGGFLEVADFLIKAGADVELGASTPLMEASQEGHLELVRYLLNAGAKVHAQTQTGDTALTYACENGHTDVADLLLRYGADLEHESEGGRTPLMKACRAGHSCTVQYLIGKGADVNRMTANGDHTPLSLACAGGHAEVVKFLLLREADPFLKLKDNSTTLIEAAKGGHTEVVELLLDFPRSLMREGAMAGKEGLSAAQAAQLGLTHVPAPGQATRTIVPQTPNPPQTTQHTAHGSQYAIADVFNDGGVRKKSNPSCGKPAGPTCTSSMKHKCCRKSRAAPPQADHHLPPPPDILEQQWLELTNEEREEMARAITSPPPDLIDPPGPPTLVTSALQALDLQFCAQGVTTTGYPPQQQFPVPQLPPSVEQQKLQQLAQHRLILPLYEADQQRPEAFAPQAGAEAGDVMTGGETRELTAVLAYLQREVPSLDALPRNELRSLVLEVMQQKNHEIGDKIQQITCDFHRASEEHSMVHGTLLGLLQRPSPVPAEGEPPIKPFTFPNVSYDETYRAPTFPSPHMPVQQPVPQPPQTLQPQPQQPQMPQQPQQPPQPHEHPQPKPERKREQHTNTSVKKKARVVRSRAGAPTATFPVSATPAPTGYCAMDVDGETDSTHDTALTLACAGGHEDLVELLLARGADIEHRDKKGFTPLILAATAGHDKIVEILLNNGADIEAQSERTKDTPLSLACSGGRYDVVDLILSRGANKEHRNVSDYTPLSLAASGGYVNIIRMLLQHQAEINSRTGSKLGISPLMLAAMNGHTAAVRLLLDCGSDINAQIETNRNTALTLACFQGRHEVVSLLLDRKANVEHRAKTGLTPLMEAASGGYVEVGRVLLDKGADVNAPPVPSSRDTALTIAADKGHIKFVELLLQRKAAVEVKNKKGNSPLWLAANGGHLAVVEMLHLAGADIDSQDNRKVSCLMAAFRKGHTKVVKWMVGDVTQFPSDQEMTRYICTISDKELLQKCQECVRVIRAAKETQAARANQNATILLEELESERCREETKRQAAARRRERKKKKKMEKKEVKRKLLEENDKNSVYSEKGDGESEGGEQEEEVVTAGKEEGDSGIDANSQGSCSSSDVKAPPASSAKSKRKKKDTPVAAAPVTTPIKLPDKVKTKIEIKPEKETPKCDKKEKENVAPTEVPTSPAKSVLLPSSDKRPADKKDKQAEEDISKSIIVKHIATRKSQVFESTKINVEKDIDERIKKTTAQWEVDPKSTSPKGGCVGGRREEGWKEVVRKSSVQTLSTIEPGCKKVSVASHAISRVIGRAGCNINAIRSATGAHIEVDKQSKGQGERIITIKGSAEATKQAAALIASMIRDPDAEISQLIPRAKLHALMTTPQPLQPKTPKQLTPKTPGPANLSVVMPRATVPTTRPVVKPNAATPRAPPPRLQPQASTEKRNAPTTPTGVSCTPPKPTLSYTGAIVGARSNTFASKLSATPGMVDVKPRVPALPVTTPATPTTPTSARTPRESPPASVIAKCDEELLLQRPPSHVQLSPESTSSWSTAEEVPTSHPAALHINTTPQTSGPTAVTSAGGVSAEYSLFKDMNVGGGMWGTAETSHHNPEPLPPQVDASKAPGYRGGTAGGCSPCSRASSHGSTPPPNNYMEQNRHTQTPHQQRGSAVNNIDMSGLTRNGPIYQDNTRNVHMQQVPMSSVGPVGSVGQQTLGLNYVDSVSRLNPRAPDYCARSAPHHLHKHNAQLFGTSSASVGNLLMSYQQQQQQTHKQMHGPPQPPTSLHHFHPLLDRGIAAVGAGGWVEEEERKPRPIGTERAWKMNATDEWHQPEHERFQTLGGVSGPGLDVGFGGSGPVGGVGGLSLMHNLPVHFMTNATQHNEHHNWDHQQIPNEKPQGWNKWSH